MGLPRIGAAFNVVGAEPVLDARYVLKAGDTMTGNLLFDVTNATELAPAKISLFNFVSTGQAFRFSFGGVENTIQNSFGKAMDITSFHTLRLVGNSNSLVHLAFSTESGIGTLVIAGSADGPALVAQGAVGQSADIFQVIDSSSNEFFTIDFEGVTKCFKDLTISTNGATETTPRVLGFTDSSTGEAARFQFGDPTNALQNSFGKSVDLYSFNTLRLMGRRFSATAPAFVSDLGIGVLVQNTSTDVPALVVRGAASQTEDLFKLQSSTPTDLFKMDKDANITTNVGIGVAPASAYSQLHIQKSNGSGIGPEITLINNGNNSAALSMSGHDPGASNPPQTRIVASDSNFSAHLIFYTKTPGADANALVERFRIQNDGVILISNDIKHVGSNVGFFSVGPVAQQTDGAALTNNVTSGGTTNTIADFSDLTTYSVDAQTIHDDIYQLARKVKIIDDAMRAYGLLS